MNKISVHLDLTNERERIMFEYIQLFDLMFDYLNTLPEDQDMPEHIYELLRDYNIKMARSGERK